MPHPVLLRVGTLKSPTLGIPFINQTESPDQYSKNPNKNFPEEPEFAISGKVFCLRVKVFNQGSEPFGPVGQDPESFLFKGFWTQKSLFVKGLRVLGPVRASILALLAFLGRPRASNPGKVL